MFRVYEVNIKSTLSAGINHIRVQFASSLDYSTSQFDSWNNQYNVDVPPDCPPSVQQGFCHINFIRKEPCSYSWDWGPAFAPIGIYKNISLIAYNTIKLSHLTVVTTPVSDTKEYLQDGMSWTLQVAADVDSTEAITATSQIQLNDQILQSDTIMLVAGQNHITSSVTVDNVNIWWPNGYGDANLYTLTFTVTLSNSDTTSKTIKIGFRTIQLIQEPIPSSPGASFYFQINNLPIFIKGANWVPADAFENRVTRSVLSGLMQSYVDANFNTLRVWGGGVYQQDDFYDLADENGILIWQEFMFACALYPNNTDFLSNVAAEVQDQVHRLQHHASLLLWSGNNENEAAIAENWYSVKENLMPYFKEQYSQLYFQTVINNISSIDTSRPILASSPSDGNETASNPVSIDPQWVFRGDVHYYNYLSDCWNLTTYLRPRFASEYGFQSYPSLISLATVSNASLGDWNYNSSFTLHRQHHDGGNNEMLIQMKYHFDVPKSQDSVQAYKHTLWMTQVVQAVCIKTETEHYRRIKNEDFGSGGHTMGTLYWQANDIWQGASWSSIEYGGRWKVLHYYAQSFYSPLLVSPFILGDQFSVYVVSDLLVPTSAQLLFSLYSWSNGLLTTWKQPFTQPALMSSPVYNDTVDGVLARGPCAQASDCVLTVQAINDTQVVTAANVVYLSSLKDVKFEDPKLSIIDITQVNQNQFDITIQAAHLTPLVWLETPIAGRFNDNGFLMTNSQQQISFFATNNDITVEQLKNTLDI